MLYEKQRPGGTEEKNLKKNIHNIGAENILCYVMRKLKFLLLL